MKVKSPLVLLLGMLLVVGFLTTAVCQAQPADPAKQVMDVKLKDGRVIRGVVTKTATGIRVDREVGTMTFSTDEVESITKPVLPQDAYIERKSKIDTTDAQQLYELAKWVQDTYPRDTALLKLADKDLDAALKIDPKHRRAQLLQRQIRARLAVNTGAATATPVAPSAARDKVNLVSEQDMYWIRLKELQPTDRAVKVQYKNKALVRYMDAMRGQSVDGWDQRGTRDRFLRMSRPQQVMQILKNCPDDTELLKDIQIQSDPAFMRDFRLRVWPLVRANCATASCHGGAKPQGKLQFVVVPGTDARVDYTNFVILAGFKCERGRLLDRQNIDSSLLLAYGLDRKISDVDHSPAIRTPFVSWRDPKLLRIQRWMRSLKGPRAPNYHLTYKYPYGKLDMGDIPILGD